MEPTSKSSTPHQILDVPHPDYNRFTLLRIFLGIGGLFYMFPALRDVKSENNLILFCIWGFIALFVIAILVQSNSRIQMTSTEFINVNTLTKWKRSIRFDEIHSYRIELLAKSKHLKLVVTTPNGDLIQFILHPDLKDVFIAKMGQYQDTEVDRKI